MSYHLHVSPADEPYLANLPLSVEARAKINAFIDRHIKNVSDEFRADPENRKTADPKLFVCSLILYDQWGDRKAHCVRFIIDDSHIAAGVLLLAYVDAS